MTKKRLNCPALVISIQITFLQNKIYRAIWIKMEYKYCVLLQGVSGNSLRDFDGVRLSAGAGRRNSRQSRSLPPQSAETQK
jgi:hypothetical protein